MTIADISARLRHRRGLTLLSLQAKGRQTNTLRLFIVVITNDIPLIISAVFDRSPWQYGILGAEFAAAIHTINWRQNYLHSTVQYAIRSVIRVK